MWVIAGHTRLCPPALTVDSKVMFKRGCRGVMERNQSCAALREWIREGSGVWTHTNTQHQSVPLCTATWWLLLWILLLVLLLLLSATLSPAHRDMWFAFLHCLPPPHKHARMHTPTCNYIQLTQWMSWQSVHPLGATPCSSGWMFKVPISSLQSAGSSGLKLCYWG